MPEKRTAEACSPERASAPVCRWRTSAETLDITEALERIEALLIRLDDRLRTATPAERPSEEVRK